METVKMAFTEARRSRTTHGTGFTIGYQCNFLYFGDRMPMAESAK
jgi:hypothetical protein